MKIHKTKISAEAGVNHNGSIKLAKELIDVAAYAGADFVKFQTFKAKTLVTKGAEKAKYQKNLTETDESHFNMIQKLELNRAAHLELSNYCLNKNINFLSTPFDIPSIDLLLEIEIPFFKIPSGEITNLPYLKKIGSINKPVVMSTGMSSMSEVRAAMKVLIKSGMHKNNLTILHCNTEYPTPIEDVNLSAMITIRDELKVDVGYSDHTLGINVPIAATAMGAKIIEKHFTLDRNLPGPDHAASLEPNELNEMVRSIRNIEKAIGSGIKQPSKSEMKNIDIARKSIVAKKLIKKGEVFTENNLAIKRPGTGISPMSWDKIIGSTSKKNYNIDELI